MEKCPTDSSPHFCLINSVCHQPKNLLTHQVFIMKKNLCDGQPSRPRLQWTLPRKTASILFWLTGQTPGKPLENTHTSSSWRVPPRFFRSCSAGFLCELCSGSSLQQCFALCERTMSKNWRTTAVVLNVVLTAHRAWSGLKARDRFVDLSVAISASIPASLQP